MDEKVERIIEDLYEKFSPISIFLYGSRARSDFLRTSDYEIGILYSEAKKISRTELSEFSSNSNIRFYPFERNCFVQYKIDTPFPKSIYYRELVLSGKTLKGERILEKLNPPSIKVIDLLQSVEFNTGLALASVLSYRKEDFITSKIEFSKSCLFGTRCLIILEKKKFPLMYKEIYQSSTDLETGDYGDTIKHAIDVRGGKKLEEPYLYKNISFLNQIVKESILAVFRKKGNRVIIN